MMFEKMNPEKRDIINRKGLELEARINERLKDFVPSGRYGFMEKDEARYRDPFLDQRRSEMVFLGGQYEAQAIADEMAGGIYAVVIREVIGEGQRFHAFVTNYLGDAQTTLDK